MMNADNPKELLPLVNNDGIVIGKAARKECHDGSKKLHPVVHLHFWNKKHQLLLQKRPSWKDIQPNRWDTAVGGHVGYGETITEALMREAEEELGIRLFSSKYITNYIFESEVEKELVHIFATCSEQTPLLTEEISALRFFTVEEIQNKIGHDFFTPNFESEFQRFFTQIRVR